MLNLLTDAINLCLYVNILNSEKLLQLISKSSQNGEPKQINFEEAREMTKACTKIIFQNEKFN